MSSPRLTDAQLAEQFGRRQANGLPLFEPGEFGYHCPHGHTANSITWSEFEQHIWCHKCNADFHYSQDCYLVQPEWMNQADWDAFLAGLPQKPTVKPGTVPGVF